MPSLGSSNHSACTFLGCEEVLAEDVAYADDAYSLLQAGRAVSLESRALASFKIGLCASPSVFGDHMSLPALHAANNILSMMKIPGEGRWRRDPSD